MGFQCVHGGLGGFHLGAVSATSTVNREYILVLFFNNLIKKLPAQTFETTMQRLMFIYSKTELQASRQGLDFVHSCPLILLDTRSSFTYWSTRIDGDAWFNSRRSAASPHWTAQRESGGKKGGETRLNLAKHWKTVRGHCLGVQASHSVRPPWCSLCGTLCAPRFPRG